MDDTDTYCKRCGQPCRGDDPNWVFDGPDAVHKECL